MSITQRIRQFSLLLVLSLLLLLGGTTASAEFGQNVYGKCAYGVSSSCTKHTTTTTPTGLQVDVNLTNGQIISPSGYDIVITPLNGQGSSFASADIYIDGVKVATVYPAPNGTATWHWDTEKYSSGDIKIVITDTSGNTTDLPFKVTIGSPTTTGNTSSVDPVANEAQPGVWFGARLADSVTGKAKQFIRSLPPRIVQAFPYLLFLLIIIEILILTYQTRRELRVQQKLKALAERERDIVAMKQKFTSLVSHYLRTPLTILQGGAEGYAAEPTSGEAGSKLAKQVASIHATVESIVAHTNTAPSPAASVVGSAGEASRVGIGKILAVWLPVVLIGLLAAMFVYLAISINEYDAGVITILTQLVVFSILVVMVYLLFRQWQLHRSSVAAAQVVLDQERAVQKAEDAVIGEAATVLSREKNILGSLVAAMPTESSNAKFVRSGFSKLSKTIDKFVIASQLKGAVSADPFVAASLEGLVKQASAPTAAIVQQKQVVIKLNDQTDVVSRNTGLLTLVLQTLLDNAVSHSNDNGVVEVGKTANPAATELYVADHGEGLTPDEIADLFQPFNRLEEVETFNREGLGFSLYLDKLIMSYLGGDISVQSAPREETRFVLTLPSATSPAK